MSSAATRRDSTMGGTSIDARAELAERAWDSRELEPVDHCPACGAGDRTQLYADLHDRAFGQAPGRWQLWICDACGCHYLPSRPTEASIGRAYADYYTHAVPPEPFPAVEGARRVERRARQLARLRDVWGYAIDEPVDPNGELDPAQRASLDRLVRHLPAVPEGRLLDVGAGNGTFLRRMDWLGWRAQGVEPDPRAAELARAAGVRIVGRTASELSAGDAPYDAITLDHVLEHVHDPVGLLRDLWSRLNPGGRLWIATPNPASDGHRSFARDWFPLQPPSHLALFGRPALDATLDRAGVDGEVVQHATCEARWCFDASRALADGHDPLAPERVRGLRGQLHRLRARRADRAALRDARRGEETVLTIEKRAR